MTPRHTVVGRLTRELASLPHLNCAALLERWREVCGGSPPPRLSRSLLIRALAHRLQEKTYGGLPAATRRTLVGLGKIPSIKAKVPPLRPGTVLVREWQGTVHRVVVIEAGVIYRGKRHRSLSEVARLITGSRWSGPRFFGLTARATA